MTRILSGIQPTGDLHLGNHLGAVRRWVEQQDDVDAFYCIVDLHAMTLPHDPEALNTETLRVAALLLAAGLDPARCTLFVQSHLHEHAEMAWLLNCVASYGELQRMVQWKEKSEGREFVPVALFDYPVLQAADILLYQADQVPVGDDQRQHLELTRNIAERFNHRFGEVFTVPEATFPPSGARVMDLQQVDRKMSKSIESPKGTIRLLDEPDAIRKKIMSAVTDSGSEIRAGEDKPGVTNLLDLLSAVTGEEVPVLEERFQGKGYGELKREIADAVLEFLRPLQERYQELSSDPESVREALRIGAERARSVAEGTLARAKDAMGLLPPQEGGWARR